LAALARQLAARNLPGDDNLRLVSVVDR